MKIISAILIALLLGIAAQTWAADSKREIAQALTSAKSISLLSLEPGEKGARNVEGACVGHCYFSWPVLGKTTLSPAAAKSIREDLSAWAAAPEPDSVAMCFNPRHGVRVLANGHTYDFVVCFECAQTQVFKDFAVEPIAHLYYAAIQESWDVILSSANVQLATVDDSDGS